MQLLLLPLLHVHCCQNCMWKWLITQGYCTVGQRMGKT